MSKRGGDSMTQKKSLLEQLSYKATKWIGTTQAVILHTVFFSVSFALIPFVGFDRVMLVLTTVVSLEAIYLALFIQMAVNRQHKRLSDIEDDIDEILEDTESLTEEQKSEIKNKIQQRK